MKNILNQTQNNTSYAKKLMLCLAVLMGALTVTTSLYITNIAEAACAETPDSAKGTNTMTVSIPQTGTYKVWSRIIAPDTNNNSYYLQIDGGCAYRVGDAQIPTNTWSWVGYQNGTPQSGINVSLTAGNHQIVMTGRETNVGVDKVLFLSDLGCVPTGKGDNCTTTTPPPPPTDTNPPTTRTDVVPGTGAVISQDLATSDNPCPIWGNISSPANYGCSKIPDPFIVTKSGDGDPHIPVSANQPNDHYRRYISKAGVSSVYDSTYGNPDVTRTQTEKWSNSGNQMSFPLGTYAFYMSFRLQSPSPFPNVATGGGGITEYSQLFQFKSHGDGSSNRPPLVGSIGKDSLQFKSGSSESPPQEYKILNNVPTGRWLRMAIVVNWQDDNPWYEIWGDFNNSNKMVKLVDRVHTADLTKGRPYGAMGIGFYHKLSLFDGTVSGQPRQPEVYTDYANVQMTNWSEPGTNPPPPPTADTTPPETTINNVTINSSVVTTATFSSSESGSTFECKIDGWANYKPCTSPQQYTDLSSGNRTIEVRAIDKAGNVDPTPATKTFVVPNPPIPPPPTTDTTAPQLTITSPVNNAIVTGNTTINANASDNVGVTKVEFSVNNSLKMTDTTTPYNYSINTLAYPNGVHTIRAKAYDAAGNSKTVDLTLNVQNADTTPPNSPASLNGQVTQPTNSTTGKVTLNWSAATDNFGGSGLKAYLIYRNDQVISFTTGTQYADNNLPVGTYTYSIRTVDNADNTSTTSSPTYKAVLNAPQQPDTQKPSTPANLDVKSTAPTQVDLSWNASIDQGGSGLAGYNVYRNGSNTPVNSQLITTTSFGDATVDPETSYTYQVEAVDGAGNKSQKTSEASITTKKQKRSDINGDDVINIFDLSKIAANWGKASPQREDGDINGDGKIDVFDLSILATDWGQ